MLFKHKNNTDVAVEVLKKFTPKGKDYAYIKVRWWNIGRCHPPWCMNIDTWLKTTTPGKTKARRKYPLEKWKTEWEAYEQPINNSSISLYSTACSSTNCP